MTTTASFTIGEFAKETGLSLKALRLYDLSGLLAPASVDAATGFRYYSPEQIERTRRISLLRRRDMPLAEVGSLLEQPGELAARALTVWWNEQERSLTEKRGTVDYLVPQLVSDPSPTHHFDIETRHREQQKVAGITTSVLQADLLSTLNISVTAIRRHLRSSGAVFDDEFWVLFHGVVSPDSDGPIEICIPFSGSVEPIANIAIRLEAAQVEAYTSIGAKICQYPQILYAYDAVAQWVGRHGQSSGSPREIYAYPWDDRPGAGPVVDISTPFTPLERSS